MSEDMVNVMLSVNGEGGHPTGHVDAVHVDDGLLELEGEFLYPSDNPTCSVFTHNGVQKVRVGRRVWPIHGYNSWVGNWCWDEVTMERRHARELIAHVISRGFTIVAWSDDCDLLPKKAAA